MLPEHPMRSNTLFNAKLVALLIEQDQVLSSIVKALQDKEDKINANFHHLNQLIRDLHESILFPRYKLFPTHKN